MTRDQAVKRLHRLFGKRAYYRVYDERSSPELRAAALEERQRIVAERDKIDADIAERMKQLGIPELQVKRRELCGRIQAVLGTANYYKFSIGNLDNILGAFHIKAQGDTWEECFEKLDKETR